MGDGLAPPPRLARLGATTPLRSGVSQGISRRATNSNGKPLTSWYSAFVAVWRLPYAPLTNLRGSRDGLFPWASYKSFR
jgi:hypothetical protein